MARDFEEEFDGDWTFNRFVDGTEQCFKGVKGQPPYVFIERVIRPGSRRKRWVVVNREHVGNRVYAPKLAGPFDDLDTAKVAYLMIVTSMR